MCPHGQEDCLYVVTEEGLVRDALGHVEDVALGTDEEPSTVASFPNEEELGIIALVKQMAEKAQISPSRLSGLNFWSAQFAQVSLKSALQNISTPEKYFRLFHVVGVQSSIVRLPHT